MSAERLLWEQIEKIGRKPEPTPAVFDPDVAFEALEAVGGVECADFMFMGISLNDRYLMFKNIITRRYIYVPNPR